ncbi:MAG TPA: hypothetical protein PK668_13810 [Myxococcota bacterium]|nr:hypothetical protein [Myxococcota bacterium]HRY94061.1 hypothetical protein [Myxococcota bacterium]HSA21360.1 hypothetical protein [Myxococcota bacterium]
MFSSGSFSLWICQGAVLGAVALGVVEATRAARAAPRQAARLLLLALAVAGLALLVRMAAPWGPHVASGRDVLYIDTAILGDHGPQAPLLVACFAWLGWLSDPLEGLVWGQLLCGTLGCALLALLTWQLTRDAVAAWAAGLLTAGLVALARVDASPSTLPALRLFLLLGLVLAARYRSCGSRWSLAGAILALVAASHGRLEAPLLAGLAFLWVLVDPGPRPVQAAPPAVRPWWPAGLMLGVGMLGLLLAHLSAVLLCLALGVWLWRRHGRGLLRVELVAGGVALAGLLLFRLLSVVEVDRETSSRFPVAFMFLVGHLNILLADPLLCSPVVLAGIVLGYLRARAASLELRRYLTFVAWPTFVFYLLFMGDTSARIKLQGLGIMLLVPVAGLGASVCLDWLVARVRRVPRAAWMAILAASATLVTAPLASAALSVETTLQQEYRFWRSLEGRIPPGSTLWAPAADSRKTLVVPPRVLQQRLGITVRTVGAEEPLPEQAGSLVYLSAGCRRYNDGYPLPGLGHSLTDEVRGRGWSWWQLVLRFAWDKNTAMEGILDELTVLPWEECQRWLEGGRLEPRWTAWSRRSTYEGRFLPAEAAEFGVFMVRSR